MDAELVKGCFHQKRLTADLSSEFAKKAACCGFLWQLFAWISSDDE